MFQQINDFFEATTIHGFAYLSQSQRRSTRIIWSVIVTAAAVVVSYFLFETVDRFDAKYVSTTIETQKVNEFPFPAVTFIPGDSTLKDNFVRTFMNEFEFTRYKKENPTRDNKKFMEKYEWLVSPMNDKLFKSVEKFLINERSFLENKGSIFKVEVCSLVALKMTRNVKLRGPIITIFQNNMYKYTSFNDLMRLIKTDISPIIDEEVSKWNITKTEKEDACDDKSNSDIKQEMEAILLSYMFIFLGDNPQVGAGDLATETPFQTGLSKSNKYHNSTHQLITKMYNSMVNGSLPVSIVDIPSFFGTVTEKNFWDLGAYGYDDENYKINTIKNFIKNINISDESLRNYHYYWKIYNSKNVNITLYCLHTNGKGGNCSSRPLDFKMAMKKTDFMMVKGIKNNPKKGQVFEGNVTSPPCRNKDVIDFYKFGNICNFLTSISQENALVFLKLMKFTKQSPVCFEDEEEYKSIFSEQSTSNFEYTLKKKGWIYQGSISMLKINVTVDRI